jgi:hypothetical protein
VKKQGGGANPAPKIDHVRITVYTTAALPVELIDFDFDPDYDGVKLNWETASEKDNQLFRVQRSRDLQHWANIGEVDGAGNSNRNIRYSWIDEDPPFSIAYYRLEQLDFDGKVEHSDIISSNGERHSESAIWSSSDGIHLKCSSLDAYPSHLMLTSLEGKTLSLHELSVQEEEYHFHWEEGRPSPGVYFYQLYDGTAVLRSGKLLIEP